MALIAGFGELGMNGFLASLVATLSCAEDSVDIFSMYLTLIFLSGKLANKR